MPTVKVDGVEIEVPQRATVLQACELAGREVARFGCRERLSWWGRIACLPIAFAAMVAGPFPSPALAQGADQSSSSQSQPEDGQIEVLYYESDMSGRQLGKLRRMVRCVAEADPVGVRNYVSLPYSGREQARYAVDGLMAGGMWRCLNRGRLSFNTGLFARSLVSQVLSQQDEAVAAIEGPRNPLETLAFCVLGSAEGESRAFLVTGPASPSERNAFDRLRSASGPCWNHVDDRRIALGSLRSLLTVVAYNSGRSHLIEAAGD